MSDRETPCGPISWVFDKPALRQLVAAVQSSSEVVMDLETTGLDEHARRGGPTNGGVPAHIVLASLTLPQEGELYDWRVTTGPQPRTWLVPLSHPDSPFLGV